MTEPVVTTPASGWVVTDSTLDHAHENAIDVFDTDTAVLAMDLRERLAAQLPTDADGHRPGGDTPVPVTLTTAEWRALADLLRREAQWSQEYGGDAVAAAAVLAQVDAIESAVRAHTE